MIIKVVSIFLFYKQINSEVVFVHEHAFFIPGVDFL